MAEKYLVYSRKTSRHNWRLVGTAEEPLGVARVVYHVQSVDSSQQLGIRIHYCEHNSLILEHEDFHKPGTPLVQKLDCDQYAGNGQYNVFKQIAQDLRNRGLPLVRRKDTCDGLGCEERLTSNSQRVFMQSTFGGQLEKLILCPVCYSGQVHRQAIRNRDLTE